MKKFNLFYIIITISLLGCTEDSIDLASGSLEGTVRALSTNEPLANVKITTTPSTKTVYSDEEGSFQILESIPINDYSVKAELKGYLTEYEAINIKKENQSVSVAFELSTDESLNSAPNVPELTSPKDMYTNLSPNTILQWKSTDKEEDSLTYRVLINNNATNTLIEHNNLSEDTLELKNLIFGATYTWQVAVSDGVNPEVFSESSQFTVQENPNYPYHYVQLKNGNYRIYASDLDSNTPLTSTSTSSWRPHANLIAMKLAFLQTKAGETRLVTSDLNGKNIRKISQIPINGFQDGLMDFAWKTDGSKLIFPSFDKLYKVNNDGTGQHEIYQTTHGRFITKCAWSYNGAHIAIVTNNINGYKATIEILSSNGSYQETIFDNKPGAVGGIDWNITGEKLVYAYDDSGYQDINYRQLNSSIYLYDFTDQSVTNISNISEKPQGTNDYDPQFSPNDAKVVFSNSSNTLHSRKAIYSIELADYENSRTELISIGGMPDFKL